MKRKTGIAIVSLSLLACASVSDEIPAPETEPFDHPVSGTEALDESIAELLEKSRTDSCAVCAREALAQAFALAEERFPPGTRVSSEGNDRFWLLPGDPNRLALGPSPPADPLITFRFHTETERLIGVNPAHLTPESTAGSLVTGPPGTAFRGALEVIPYVYGDGAAFLHRPASGRLEVMCRLVKRSDWKAHGTE